jgi:hypothetical protein
MGFNDRHDDLPNLLNDAEVNCENFHSIFGEKD